MPDLILMDIQMPVMDGMTAAGILKADPATSGLKIIALTSFAMRGRRGEIPCERVRRLSFQTDRYTGTARSGERVAGWGELMNIPVQLLIFTIDGKRYAIHLQAVERVVPAVEITPLPEGPEIVTGAINVHGQVIPVLNIRRKFRLPERSIAPDDNIVIVKGTKWTVAFAVDALEGVVERGAEEITPAGSILPNMEYTEGVIKIDDDIVFLHDIDKALSFEEKESLEAIVAKGQIAL